MYCTCGATDCRSCGPAQGYDPDIDAIEVIAQELLDEYLADPKWLGEASASFTDDEYQAIERAHAERNSEKLFAVRDAAMRRVLRKWADEDAWRQFEALRQGAEAEAALERITA